VVEFINSKPVLLIRAANNDSDVEAFEKLGLRCLVDPYLSINASVSSKDATYLLAQLATANAPLWLIATSVNAIEKWAELVGPEVLKQTIERRNDLRFAAIAERTAATLMKFGATRVVTPETGDSENLGALLAELSPATAILPSGSLAMKALPNKLRVAGWNIISGVVYETKTVGPRPKTAEQVDSGEFEAVILRSPSAARALVAHTSAARVGLAVFAAGKTTAAVAAELGLNVVSTSPNPTPASVAETVKKWFQQKGIA